MNWEEIKKKYPKGYNKLDKHYTLSAMSDIYGVHYPHFRELYDFFDEQGIIIGIELDTYENDIVFDYEIRYQKYGLNTVIEDYNYKTRTEAEERAFLQAFTILEERL